jgi:hypothetical protein
MYTRLHIYARSRVQYVQFCNLIVCGWKYMRIRHVIPSDDVPHNELRENDYTKVSIE